MKSIRREQLSMIHLFGDPAFQLKRLNVMKEDHFQAWSDLEKATYYMAARKLIEEELRGYDRVRDREGFAGLLRNRYETFLAQAGIDPRPQHKVLSYLQLSRTAEHEEGPGQGDKYFQEALEWIPKVEAEYQDDVAQVFVDGFKRTPKGLGALFLKTMNAWEAQTIFRLAVELFETMAEAGQVDEVEYRAMAEAAINVLRNEHEAELVLRLTNRLVQLAREYEAQDRSVFWKYAYDAACGYGEPYTKMLMAVLLGDLMKQEENWQALEGYLEDIDEVTSVYGEVDTFGGNFDQISEAVAEMREALAAHFQQE